ncbi:26211_t:CDS:1, partial [Dentiscutata erythropus]
TRLAQEFALTCITSSDSKFRSELMFKPGIDLQKYLLSPNHMEH